MNSWWSKLQPGHVMMVQPRFSIELFNHHDSSALTIGNHLVYGMKCFKAMNWVQEDYTRGSKTILEVKSQFPSMLVPAACFHDFWCAKYEYCMATRYLPVGRMVTKAIRPTEGTKIIFVSSCVGLLCHLSWHLPASGNHPSHQRWLWRWWRRGLHQLIDEDPDFFPAGVGENPILVTLPTGSHTMTWLVQLKWRDLRSSLTVPWQLHSIHCSQDERGRPSACEEDNV